MIFLDKIINIFPILFYPFANILILIILGFGLTYLIIPKNLKSYLLWLSPWTTIILSIFYFVIMSLFGLSVKQTLIPLILAFLLIDIYVLKKWKPIINLDNENLILGIIVGLTLILNLSPLIRQDKILTTISMGNNDVIVYTATGDYLKDHSIAESYKENVDVAVSTILHAGYRWGTPIINSFFLVLLNLQAYQYTYVSQAVLFSLFIPLIYILFRVLFGRSSTVGLIITTVFTGFNANLLYMLYHDFFGQVLFWGITAILYLFFYIYFNSKEIKLNKFNRYDFILGITITVLYFSYHEPAVFMFAPIIVFLFLTFIYKRKLILFYIKALLKIALISVIPGFKSIIYATVFDFKQAFMANFDQPIGWNLFRNKIPYANPFEAMGFWSIHNFDPMPAIFAVVLSAGVVFFIIKGVMKGKYKILTISYLLIFLLFFYGTAFNQHNFFAYNRALTYTLPFFIVLFSIGLVNQFEKRRYFWAIIIVVLISLELFSAVKLNKRFIREHLSIGKSQISILELKSKKIKEPIYAERYLMNEIPLWLQMWPDHFLYSKGVSITPTIFNDNPFENKVPDNSLVLISKPTPWYRSPQVLLKSVVWENKYYRLGRLCNSNECLIERKEDLSKVEIGKSDYEDSLLINGWSVKEESNRWAVSKESTLRLVTTDKHYSKLLIEASTVKEPQELSVYIDDQFIGKQSIKTEWQEYRFNLQIPLSAGVHKILFKYSEIYRPIDLGINQDVRELGVNFKKIRLN